MPGKRGPKATEAQMAHAKLMWAQDASGSWAGLGSWEPRGEEFTQAILEVLASGAALLLRPGSGGRAVGIAIWEGDTRHPAQWCYDDEEVNLWTADILRRAAKTKPAEPTEE